MISLGDGSAPIKAELLSETNVKLITVVLRATRYTK